MNNPLPRLGCSLGLLPLLSLAACDPPPYNYYDMGTVIADSRVLNPRPVIHLGDSVALTFEVRDSVKLNGVRTAIVVGTQDGGDVGFDINRLNPLHAGGFEPNTVNCLLYAQFGTLSKYNSLSFAHGNKRLISKLYLIPKKRGIYFFDQGPLGYLDLNDQKLKVRCGMDFGNIDRHIQLLVDSARAGSNLDRYLQSQRDLGREIYGFRVM